MCAMDPFQQRMLAQVNAVGRELEHRRRFFFKHLGSDEQAIFTQQQQRAMNAVSVLVYWTAQRRIEEDARRRLAERSRSE